MSRTTSFFYSSLILAAGCGGMSPTGVDTLREGAAADTAASFDEARDRALSRHVLTAREAGDVPPLPMTEEGELPSVLEVLAAAPTRGLAGRESIVLFAAPGTSPRPALLVPSCHDGHSCSCDEGATHVMARDLAGRDIVLRMTPVDHVESVHQAGACGYGCGVPSPPRPPYVYLLRGSPDELRVIDVPYDRHSVSVSCDEEIGVP